MPAPASVRAVVVTWNGAHLLPDCLDSLLAQTVGDDLEVLVVDNASTDGTTELLAERYPSVRVVRAPRNLGFAGGVALGTRDFAGEWYVLLNNDATFAPDAVERLRAVATAPGAADVAAVTARILLAEPDGGAPRRVNSTGNVVTRAGTGTDRDYLAPIGSESTDPDVFGFCGGAALLRRAALDAVGGFDGDLFLYYEDTDVSWRLRAAGHRVVYAADAVAVHRHAASSGTDSPLFRYHNTRNSLTVFTRHAPVAVVAGSAARQLAGLLRAAARSGPRDALVRARSRGLRDWALRLPRTVAERRRTWAGAAVPRAEVARYLGGH
ncbi:glycosyltransferase family 2 protein [Cellulomonas hominis]|uniref:Glycosyltransferase family 2 protein n=1 Tax=Cellulomonas hominis TaxID=156981 RepID=A0A7Z8JYU2_9CELL|nr:glycosyltransferase family 2 protein [Cellulomonas hominis]TKR23671.1 glycosyltransferase family 2 protein [Cellulomonas hominis]